LNSLPEYQVEQNKKDEVNFNQDLEVIEKLIEKYVSDGSISKVFEKTFPIRKHPFLGGWVEFSGLDIVKKKGKNDVENFDKSDAGEKKIGARLLMLLAYIMMSTVGDDNSNNTQM